MDGFDLRRQIYESAENILSESRVTDVIVGLSMLAVELDGKYLGVSYVLREGLGGGCSIFPYVSEAVGMSAAEVGLWFPEGRDNLQRGIGCAVINAAASAFLNLQDTEKKQDRPFDLKINKGDKVGMIGNIRPAVKMLKPFGPEMIIFDKGKCENGNTLEDIYPMSRQAELVPECDILILSGTSTINKTADSIMASAKKAREVVLMGASVPMIPDGFKNTSATILAGSQWDISNKHEIFKLISQAAGMQILSKYMIKRNVRINNQ